MYPGLERSRSFRNTTAGVALFLAMLSLIPSRVVAESAKLFAVGKDVISPELLPVTFSTDAEQDCKGSLHGTVQLSLIVDKKGHPRNIMFTKPLATDLDRLALNVVGADRFKPALHDKARVATAQLVDVSLSACAQRQKAGKLQGEFRLHLLTQPGQKFKEDADLSGSVQLAPEVGNSGSHSRHPPKPIAYGPGVSHPVLIAVPVYSSPQKGQNKFSGSTCVVTLLVDEHGLPENAHLLQHEDATTGRIALTLVSGYRFKPAMWHGEPVPMTLAVELRFTPNRK